MAAPIGKGDWVQCIQFTATTVGPGPAGPDLVVGSVYCVEEVVDGSEYEDGLGALVLYGVGARDDDGRRDSYDLRCFSPLGGNALSLKAPPKAVPARKTEAA